MHVMVDQVVRVMTAVRSPMMGIVKILPLPTMIMDGTFALPEQIVPTVQLHQIPLVMIHVHMPMMGYAMMAIVRTFLRQVALMSVLLEQIVRTASSKPILR